MNVDAVAARHFLPKFRFDIPGYFWNNTPGVFHSFREQWGEVFKHFSEALTKKYVLKGDLYLADSKVSRIDLPSFQPSYDNVKFYINGVKFCVPQ